MPVCIEGVEFIARLLCGGSCTKPKAPKCQHTHTLRMHTHLDGA